MLRKQTILGLILIDWVVYLAVESGMDFMDMMDSMDKITDSQPDVMFGVPLQLLQSWVGGNCSFLSQLTGYSFLTQ